MTFFRPFFSETLLRDYVKSYRGKDLLEVFSEQQPYVLYLMRKRGYGDSPEHSEIRYYLKALSERRDPNPPGDQRVSDSRDPDTRDDCDDQGRLVCLEEQDVEGGNGTEQD